MNIVERNNIKIFGRGKKPIIFAHGYGCEQTVWRRVTPAFENDYRIITYDHVGSGLSDISSYDKVKYGRLQGYAADLLEIVHELDLNEAIFVGHSVSAMIGVLAAIKDPSRFENLILVGPSPRYLDDQPYLGGFTKEAMTQLLDGLDANFIEWSKFIAPVIMGNGQRPELAEELLESFCKNKPEVAKHFGRVLFLADNRADLPKLSVNSLILQSSDDPVAPLTVGEYMHKQLKGSELVIMTATGHCPHVSAPNETVAVIQAYLDRQKMLKASTPAA